MAVLGRAGRIKKGVQVVLLASGFSIASLCCLDKNDVWGAAHATSNMSAPAPLANSNGPVSYADAVALAAPAVVSIKTTKEIPIELNPLMQDPFFRHFFGEPPPGDPERGIIPEHRQRSGGGELPKEVQQGLGSGVIVSEKGYILTNNHVIKDVDTVLVTLADGRSSEAKVVGTDPDTDLAVLKINLNKLPIIPIGVSHKLRAGDVVLAIGNPFGFDKTVTQGIVSATERTGVDVGILENLIQTDAAINPGNSGGALIDAQGHLIGINTVIYSRSGGYQGIGFAVPISQAINVMNKLIEGGHVSRGYLGVTLQPLNKEIREYIDYKEGDGVYVRATVRGSPAQKAGILPGDVIVKINNAVVKDDRTGLRLVAGLTPNKSYPIEIFRKGDYMTFAIVLGERKQPQSAVKEKAAPRKNEENNRDRE